MKKIGFVTSLALSTVLSASAFAGNVTVTVGSRAVPLPDCGGEVSVNRGGNDDVNLVFRDVERCSNFDIASKRFGFIDLNYRAKKIPTKNGRPNGERSGSFTIPKRFIDNGWNDIELVVRSKNNRTSDQINLIFVERDHRDDRRDDRDGRDDRRGRRRGRNHQYDPRRIDIGDEVYTSGGSYGRVVALYPNGNASIQSNGFVFTYPVNTLAATDGCRSGICVNDQVYSSGGTLGTVKAVFVSNNNAVVQSNGFNFIYDAGTLAATEGCDQNVCVNEQVYTSGGSLGTVKGLYDDGKAVIQSGGFNFIYQSSTLAETTGCIGRICVGEQVVTSGGSRGTVKGIYKDGKVVVQSNGFNFIYDAHTLGRTR